MQQDAFMVVALLRPGQEETLRALLAGMTTAPGIADSGNALLPLGAFETLHFSRFVILHDQTLDDLAAYGMSWPDASVQPRTTPCVLVLPARSNSPGRYCACI